MKSTFKPYSKREIRFKDTGQYNGWTLKQYSISAYNEFAPDKLFDAAKSYINDLLPVPASDNESYGVGFMIIHEGYDGNYALVSWWVGENMLRHHVLAASPENPLHFTSFQHTNIVSCVWELEILYFEKKLWSEHILMKHDNPEFSMYLKAGFSGTV
jgi:hypothetical protein